MEGLKDENDEIITLRFAEKIEKPMRDWYFLKENFISGDDQSRDFTLDEINSINTIIRLGNKITKGYEDEKNNFGNQYNTSAKIIFEPGKDYEITKREFGQLQKVFSFESNFLEMNKKIEFEFADTRKIKMRSGANLSENQVVEKLLQDNSIKIGADKNQNKIITFEPNKKYYLTLADIKLLSVRFEMDKAYPHLTSECIHKNIFDMPLDILQSFVNGFGNLNYQEYIFKERAEKNSETKKNGISYNLWAELVAIKTEYKKAKKIMEVLNLYEKSQNLKINEDVNEIKKIIEQYDFNKIDEDKLVEIIRNPNQLGEYFANEIAGKIGGIIKTCGFHEIKSQDRLLELIKNPAKFDKYFINETANKINTKIKKYGFTEIKSEDKLLNTFESSLKTGSLNSEDMNLILTKIKDSLDETILQKAINIIIENMLDGQLVDTKLLNTLEAFLFSNWEICLDDLKEVLFGKTVKIDNQNEPQRQIDGLIDNKRADYVLECLKELKNDRKNAHEAIETLSICGFISKDIQIDDEFKIAVEDILSKKSSFLSYEHIVTILKAAAAAELESSEGGLTDDINCVLQAVEKYKLDIEDKSPLKNVMRLFFNADKIDKINTNAISDKINDMLKEQIYTEMLNERPALLFLIDIDFLYKKIIVDPNDNVFKKPFYDIHEHVYNDAKRFSGQDKKIDVQYFNSFLNRISQNNEYDFDRYCYYFISFIADNIKRFDNPSAILALFCTFISRLNHNFLYERIFSGEDEKSPIKNLLGMLFEDGEPLCPAELYLDDEEDFVDNIDFGIVFESDKSKIHAIRHYCKDYFLYWVVIAYILSNLEYKPEYKDNFLYFFDLFNWNMERIYGSDCNAWLKLFNFVDPVFLFGNLDVIERYLTCCKKNEGLLSYEIPATIKTICDYDNYKDYAVEPKLNETDYFYTLLIYNERCIDYFKPKWFFDHLKDEEMKNYYQWIRDNAKSKVNDMYEYIKEKKYDNPEQQKQDILLLIEIFPDAMSQDIDAKFLIYNWDTLDLNFKEECTEKGLDHFFYGLNEISDINQKEEWYVYLLSISPIGSFTDYHVVKLFVDNFDKFSDEAVKNVIKLYKKQGDKIYSHLLYSLFERVNRMDLKNGKRIVSEPKAEKTLWLIKTFGAKKASEYVDKKFLIRNLNDQDIGNTVKECIKLCAEADDEFCKSLCEVVMDEQFYSNFEDEDEQAQKKKIILGLMNIGKEKIFEHVDNQFLLTNLGDEIIKDEKTIDEYINTEQDNTLKLMWTLYIIGIVLSILVCILFFIIPLSLAVKIIISVVLLASLIIFSVVCFAIVYKRHILEPPQNLNNGNLSNNEQSVSKNKQKENEKDKNYVSNEKSQPNQTENNNLLLKQNKLHNHNI